MRIIKFIIFRLLLALRGLILNLSKIFAIVFLIGTAGILFMDEFKNVSVTGKIIAVMLVVFCTLVNWVYDYVIFYFAPDDIDVTLFH